MNNNGSASLFPSRNSDGNCAVLDAETSDLCASSRKTRISTEAYSSTPHTGIRSLTTKLPKSAVSGRELVDLDRAAECLPAEETTLEVVNVFEAETDQPVHGASRSASGPADEEDRAVMRELLGVLDDVA